MASRLVSIVISLFVASSFPTVLAADCTASTFGVLATSPTVSLCMKDSNIPLLTMGSSPTSEQLSVVCKTPTCRQLLQELVNLNAPECTIPLAGRLRLHADLIDPTVAYCTQVDAAGSHSSSGSANTAIKEPQPTPVPSSTSASAELAGAAHMSIVVVAIAAFMYQRV